MKEKKKYTGSSQCAAAFTNKWGEETETEEKEKDRSTGRPTQYNFQHGLRRSSVSS